MLYTLLKVTAEKTKLSTNTTDLENTIGQLM